MNESSRFSRIVRNFLFGIVNKEFLIFLFFLFVSGAFWLMMTLNEDAEKELKIPVRLTGVPRNVVITSDVTDTVRVVLKDKGYMLLPYVYGEALQPVALVFKNYDKGNGKASISSSELLKLIKPMLFKSTVVTSVKPDRAGAAERLHRAERELFPLECHHRTGDGNHLCQPAETGQHPQHLHEPCEAEEPQRHHCAGCFVAHFEWREDCSVRGEGDVLS